MKRIISFLTLVFSIFAIGGCNNKGQTNVSNVEYLAPTSKENIAHNLKVASKEIKSVSFNGGVSIDGKTYEFSGKVIVKDTIANSLLYIEFDNNHLYLKNGNIYLSYFYKNTNVVVKDSVDNYVKEICNILSSKGIVVSYEKIKDVINNKTLDDVDFNSISERVSKISDGYEINYKNLNLNLDDTYLVRQLSFKKDNISLNINFDYSGVKINIPLGYEVFNVNILSVKNLLKVDNLSELIK